MAYSERTLALGIVALCLRYVLKSWDYLNFRCFLENIAGVPATFYLLSDCF